MPIRLICSLIALSQLLWFAAPAQAQGLPNFWPSPGTGGYYNGTGGVYVPRLYGGPQYGYSAASRYGAPSNGMGMMVGLGMYGGMMGIGTVMMASQMIARHNMNKKYNQNTGQGQAPTPKDKLAKADRRRSQELKLKGELDSDYQKELAEKGLTPANAPMPGSPPNFAPTTGGPGFGQGASSFNGGPGPGLGMNQGAGMGQGQGQAMGMGQGQAMNSGMNSGINPSMPPPNMNPPAATGAGEVFNPSPWTPNSD